VLVSPEPDANFGEDALKVGVEVGIVGVLLVVHGASTLPSACHPSSKISISTYSLTLQRTAHKIWLEGVHILSAHLYHLPPNQGTGIMVTLPSGLGRPVIDGNHRAARALRDGTEFLAYLLAEAESLETAAPEHGPRRRR
jgi:hypothetical protein